MPSTALIVEDEILVALDLERILIDAGYKVTAIAADKAAALKAAHDCGIAFVDVNLRDGPTGPDIATTLSRDFGVRVVFVTANPASITPDTGALAVVRKPFNDVAIRVAASIAIAPDKLPAELPHDIMLLQAARTAGAPDTLH